MGSTLLVHDAVRACVALLEARRDELDRLNVFPVPDADTGSNMVATVRAAADALEGSGWDAGPRVGDAAVRGARGNGGVVLSQVLRALLAVEHDVLTDDLAERLGRADALARAAVAAPVEGSILSVARAAAEAATTARSSGEGTTAQLRAARDAAHDEVARSPLRNDVLARAGVVDAGGRGLALVLEALLAAVTGNAPDPPDVDVPEDGPVAAACTPDGGRYEVMFLVAPTANGTPTGEDPAARMAAVADALRLRLAGIGDSVVVVAGDDVVQVHVHTDDVGPAIAAGIDQGTPTSLRVEDLHATVASVGRRPAPAPRAAVLVGVETTGLRRLVVAGGATPLALDDRRWSSTRLAAALGAAAADGRSLVLLPGREDVAAAAEEAVGVVTAVTGSRIDVVRTATGPADVVACLAELDPSAPVAHDLTTLLDEVATDVVPVSDDAAAADAAALVTAAVDRLGGLLGHEPELVTLLLPAAAPDSLVARVVTESHPQVEVEVIGHLVADGAIHVLVQ